MDVSKIDKVHCRSSEQDLRLRRPSSRSRLRLRSRFRCRSSATPSLCLPLLSLAPFAPAALALAALSSSSSCRARSLAANPSRQSAYISAMIGIIQSILPHCLRVSLVKSTSYAPCSHTRSFRCKFHQQLVQLYTPAHTLTIGPHRVADGAIKVRGASARVVGDGEAREGAVCRGLVGFASVCVGALAGRRLHSLNDVP